MSKLKKALIIVFTTLAVLAVAGVAVCFIVFPLQTKEVYERFKELLAQPLPIVGVSLIVLIGGALAIISKLNIGKKFLNELKNTNDTLKNDYEKQIKEANEILAQTKETLEYTKGIIVEICNTVPNKKVQAIAGKVENYGKREEETDSQATTEEI